MNTVQRSIEQLAPMPPAGHLEMKRPVMAMASFEPPKDALLRRILMRCGAYHHSADLFFQELWKQRLASIGFRVLLVQKMPIHDVWEIRVCGGLAAQTYLLLSKAVHKRDLWTKDVLLKQFRAEIQEIARDLGAPIKIDCITVVREGKSYLKAAFIWPKGRPGLLLKKAKKPEAFSFLIQPWLKRRRN